MKRRGPAESEAVLNSRGRSLLLLLFLSRNVAEAGVEKEGWSEACRWLKVGKYRKW